MDTNTKQIVSDLLDLISHAAANGFDCHPDRDVRVISARDALQTTQQSTPRVTTPAELRQQARSDTSCAGAFARARPGKT